MRVIRTLAQLSRPVWRTGTPRYLHYNTRLTAIEDHWLVLAQVSIYLLQVPEHVS